MAEAEVETAEATAEKLRTNEAEARPTAKAKVAVVRTSPETVLEDYRRVMELADYRSFISPERHTLIKLNLSWTKFYPACSSPPWQLEGVIKTLLEDGFQRGRLWPLENKTVVTDPIEGARQNGWISVLARYRLPFVPLPQAQWRKYEFVSPLLRVNQLWPEGIEIPTMFPGRQIIHLPTLKTHGHSITTGAVKNSFGGLLKEVRHYGHKYIHEVLVDLMMMQRELHRNWIFAVMDATVGGDGAGPRTMEPRICNYLLAGGDSVALDAVAAKMMGFDPLEIPYLRIAAELGLGAADLSEIEVVGEDIAEVNFRFRSKRSFVIYGDQMIRLGWLKPLERLLLHSPLWVWAPLASTVYHDWYWYPLKGKKRVAEFMESDWGKLFAKYRSVRAR